MRQLINTWIFIYLILTIPGCSSEKLDDSDFRLIKPYNIQVHNDDLVIHFQEGGLHPYQCYFYAEQIVQSTYSKLIKYPKIIFEFKHDTIYSSKSTTSIVFDDDIRAELLRRYKLFTDYTDLTAYITDSIPSMDVSYINYYVSDLHNNKIISSEDFLTFLIDWCTAQYDEQTDFNTINKEMEFLLRFFSYPEFENQPNVKRHIKKILSFDIN